MSSSELLTRQSNRGRKALNDLQFVSNGKDLIGKTNQAYNFKNQEKIPLNDKLNKRNSISLPDINASLNNTTFNETIKSTASTPNKPLKKISAHTSTPTKSHLKKKNISIIFEDREKENPNYQSFSQKLEKTFCSEVALNIINNKENEKAKPVEYCEIAIQCNKMDEDMLLSENVDKTNYWKLLAHKRFACISESIIENKNLNQILTELDQKNDNLRKQIEDYTNILEQSKEITRAIMEEIEGESGQQVDDSGYDAPNVL